MIFKLFNRDYELTGTKCLHAGRILAAIAACLMLFSVAAPLVAAEYTEPNDNSNLMELSIEELMEIEVTSPGKRLQRLSDVAAAVYVITRDDIRRSGATSIPEALRLAPGVQVARIDANKWAISVRGFAGRFANKLLVLIDGRTVYTSAFSGVYWDIQDTMIEDIDRIEVIRGPGAALWGANAVNGVINIITKKAKETQGGLLTAGGGTEERGFGGVRYGLAIGKDAHARGYVKYFKRDGGEDGSGQETPDDWDMLRGGFRLDWKASATDSLTVHGDVYDGSYGSTGAVPILVPPFAQVHNDKGKSFGGNLLTRWEKSLSSSSDLALQLYYQREDRDDIEVQNGVEDTVDLDFQHRFSWGGRQEIMYGAGYRFMYDRLTNGFLVSLTPESRCMNLFSAFLQDDITLVPELLRVTIGSKFEHNDFSGFEFQPDIRFIWTPHSKHTVWGSVSRAVRTPARADSDLRANIAVIPPGAPGNPSPTPLLVSLLGNSRLESEVLMAYELGYRAQPAESFSFDLTGYYHDYDRLIGTVSGTPFPELSPAPPHVVAPLVSVNNLEGKVYGVELSADWLPIPWWRMKLAYTYQRMDLHLKGGVADTTGQAASAEGKSPDHQISYLNSLDLPGNVTLDAWLRYMDELPAISVNSYVTLDMRLAWRPRPGMELSLVGQNLVDSSHREFVSVEGISTKIQRGVYGKVSFEF